MIKRIYHWLNKKFIYQEQTHFILNHLTLRIRDPQISHEYDKVRSKALNQV